MSPGVRRASLTTIADDRDIGGELRSAALERILQLARAQVLVAGVVSINADNEDLDGGVGANGDAVE